MVSISSSTSFAVSICATKRLSKAHDITWVNVPYRGSKVDDRLACNMGLLMVIPDLNIDDVHRFIEISSTSQ